MLYALIGRVIYFLNDDISNPVPYKSQYLQFVCGACQISSLRILRIFHKSFCTLRLRSSGGRIISMKSRLLGRLLQSGVLFLRTSTSNNLCRLLCRRIPKPLTVSVQRNLITATRTPHLVRTPGVRSTEISIYEVAGTLELGKGVGAGNLLVLNRPAIRPRYQRYLHKQATSIWTVRGPCGPGAYFVSGADENDGKIIETSVKHVPTASSFLRVSSQNWSMVGCEPTIMTRNCIT